MKQKYTTKALNKLGHIALLWLAKIFLAFIFLGCIITNHSVLAFLILVIIFVLSIGMICKVVSFIGVLARGNRR